MNHIVTRTDTVTAPRSLRAVSAAVLWYAQRKIWRFAYRDPFTSERKFIFCTPDKFAAAGIVITDESVVRKHTKYAESLAKKLQAAFLASLGQVQALPPLPEVITVSAAAETYFALYDQQSPGYRGSLKTIFREFMLVSGDKPIAEVADTDFKAFERRLTDRGLANATVRSNIAQLGMLFNFAMKKGWLKQDPRLTYRRPKEDLKEPDPFTEQELEAFFAFVRQPARYRPAAWEYIEWIGIGLLCLGLRPIEMEYALWEDVNWKERFLFIRRSHPNKMPQACQNQPIPLAAWPQFLARRQASGLIWPAARGEQCTPDSRARMRKTLQDAMPAFMWKRFRKSYATILEHGGNDVVTTSRLLRHSAGGKNTSIAQRHYIGKSHHFLREAVDDAFAPYAGMIGAGAATQLICAGASGA